jgi:hypothetical protein
MIRSASEKDDILVSMHFVSTVDSSLQSLPMTDGFIRMLYKEDVYMLQFPTTIELNKTTEHPVRGLRKFPSQTFCHHSM